MKIKMAAGQEVVRVITRFLACAVLLATNMPVAAQSLADVARAEEARRKAVKGQAKVFTNDTLRGADGGGERLRCLPRLHRRPQRLQCQ